VIKKWRAQLASAADKYVALLESIIPAEQTRTTYMAAPEVAATVQFNQQNGSPKQRIFRNKKDVSFAFRDKNAFNPVIKCFYCEMPNYIISHCPLRRQKDF
jgi:hypothetical protein